MKREPKSNASRPRGYVMNVFWKMVICINKQYEKIPHGDWKKRLTPRQIVVLLIPFQRLNMTDDAEFS